MANSGRPGPVLVDIPKDIQMAQGDLDPHFSTVADEMAFPQAEVAQALQMLAQSQQPMLYVGGGVGMAQAVPALREFPGGDQDAGNLHPERAGRGGC